jgi:hypothetical protein
VLSAQPEVVRETVREPEQRPKVGRADLDRIKRDGRSFVGTSVVYMNQGSRLELFVGLDEQVRRRVLDGAPMTHDAQTRPVSGWVKGRAGDVASAAAGAEDGFQDFSSNVAL